MALKQLRDQFKHLKIILWAVVAVFVLMVFVDWGSGRKGSGPSGDTAIQIGDREVSEQEFLRALKRNSDQFQRLYGDQWEQVRDQLDMAAYTAQQFVRRELILQEADRVGLKVSQQELVEAITADPSFQKEDGSFVGTELYQRILRANRMSPQEYEASLAEDLLIGKLARTMQHGVWVTAAEVEDSFRRQRESADFDLIAVPFEKHLDDVEADEDAIQAYYEDNAESFRRAEERVLRYLVVETTRLQRLLPVEDADLESYYQQHRTEYLAGEEVNARHILFRVAPNASQDQEAEAKLRAEQVAALARSGAEFAALASQHSEDPATKDNGGDLGWFGRGSMVEEFDQAVFGKAAGEVIGPVKSRFGYHVIRVEDTRPERQQTLDEVREQVRTAVLEGSAAAVAEERAAVLAERIRSERPDADDAWQMIADEDEAVVLNVSPPFSRDDEVLGIGSDPELVGEAFAAEIGDLAGPRATARGFMIWQLKEINPAGVPTLDEVRAQVTQRVRQAKALDLARVEGEELVARWRGGEDGQTLAGVISSELTEVRDHRWGQPIPRVGAAPEVDSAVFASEADSVIGPLEVAERTVVLARMVKVDRVDAEQLEEAREATRQQIQNERASQLLDAIMAERRQEMVITLNNEIMERFAPASRG